MLLLSITWDQKSAYFRRVQPHTTLPTPIRTNSMACWNAVNVLKFTVERPVTVSAE